MTRALLLLAILFAVPMSHADCQRSITRACVVASLDRAVMKTAGPGDLAAWAVSVQLKAAVGDYAGATSLMRAAGAPPNAASLLTSARTVGTAIYAIELGRDDDALQHVKAIQGGPAFSAYLFLLGRHFARSEDIPNAAAVSDQLRALDSPLASDLDVEVMMATYRTKQRPKALMMGDALLQQVAAAGGTMRPLVLRRLAAGLAKNGEQGMAKSVYSLIGTDPGTVDAFPSQAIDAILLASDGKVPEALDMVNRISHPIYHAEALIDVIDTLVLNKLNNDTLGKLCRRAMAAIESNPQIDLDSRAVLLEQLFWALPHNASIPPTKPQRGKLSTFSVDNRVGYFPSPQAGSPASPLT